MIEDAPRLFVDYEPENFDRTFHGKVTAREALAQSLNVPAVATLSRVGPEAFESRLSSAGVVLKRPRAETRGAGGTGYSLLVMAIGSGSTTPRRTSISNSCARAGA